MLGYSFISEFVYKYGLAIRVFLKQFWQICHFCHKVNDKNDNDKKCLKKEQFFQKVRFNYKYQMSVVHKFSTDIFY